MIARWFDKKAEGSADGSPVINPPRVMAGPRVPRHSGAWAVMRKRLQTEPGMRIIDVGYTSPNNINYLTELGHSIFLSDLVQDACTGDWKSGEDPDGNPIWDANAFVNQTLDFSGRTFDIVLLWTALDYLPQPFVEPVVSRLHSAMNRGGQVLAFFHTRTQGPETAYSRFHVTNSDSVDVQTLDQFPIQRSFTNRSIEKLFAGWGGHKQFLAKDSLSEVIMTR
ncbi:MAG TPA: SAM-dependent methyltransferase [Terracidiphilus sp.]|nr:SAM-dependent methyltransferase [Terracidiphilus sp.]